MNRILPLLLLLTLPSSTEAQERLAPNFWGYGATTLAGSRAPDVCFITNPGTDGPGTLQDCASRTGFRLVLCRLSNQTDHYKRLNIRGRQFDSLLVAGSSCPSGALNIRAATDRNPVGGVTSINIRDVHHFVLSDLMVWDRECAQEVGDACTYPEQKPMRLYGSHGIVMKSWFYGQNGDDHAGVCSGSVDECRDLTIFSVAFGPSKKVLLANDGSRGEGQCMPIHANTNGLSLVQVVNAQCGHRAHDIAGSRIYIQDGIAAGSGGRSMEFSQAVTAWLNGYVWMGNVPPKARTTTMFARLNISGGRGADAVRNGLVSIFVERVRGDGSLGGPYREEWSGRDGLLATSNCITSSFAIDDCPAPYDDIAPDMWMADVPAFDPPAWLPPEVDVLSEVVDLERIGPRFRLSCDGQVTSSSNLRPQHRRILRNLRDGTSPGGPGGWPTSMSAWGPYPDIDDSGELCADEDLDGLWDETEARIDLADGGDGCTTCRGLMDMSDGDPWPAYAEIYFSHTDPTVNDLELPGPSPDPGLPTGMELECERVANGEYYVATIRMAGVVIGTALLRSIEPIDCSSGGAVFR